MLWTSIVNYFTDSSQILYIYGILTLIILKESFDNQKVNCMGVQKLINTNIDINTLCESRILYNYLTKIDYYQS